MGKVTEEVLNQRGLTPSAICRIIRATCARWSVPSAARLSSFAFGDDDRPLEFGDEIKSISSEETFSRDTEDRKMLRACLREQAEDIAAKLKRKQLGAHTVQVKVRYGDFTTLTRQIRVEEPITEADEIYRLACFLLGREKLVSRPLRLLGLGVSGLGEPTYQQLALL